MRSRSLSGVSRTALAALLVTGMTALTVSARAEDRAPSSVIQGEPAFAGPDGGNDDQIALMPGGPGRGDRCAHLAERLGHIDKKLTSEQVRDILAGRLAQSGESNLKVGKVRAKDGDVVAVDIVTTSGSLVLTREISTKTGLPADLVQRCETMKAQRAALHPGVDGDHADGPKAEQKDGDHPRGDRRMMGRGPMGGPMMARDGMRDGMRDRMPGGMGGGLLGGLALVSDAGPGRDLKLTADQAKKLTDAALVMAGNPHLKVGTVKEKDADTLTVDIVTQDNALVLRREVNRHTGRFNRPA